jgi:tetratricopeptide (TPR) repeat protein
VRFFGFSLDVRLALLVIFFLALALRLLYLYSISDNIFFRELVVDQASYDRWAMKIASGQWLGHEPFYQDPLYPYFLGLSYRLFGRRLALVYLVQVVLSSLCVLPLYGIGRRLFNDPRVGLLAALFWATYKVAFFFEGQIEKTGPGLAIVIIFLWLLLLVRDRPRILYALLAGLLGSLLCLFRGNFLAVIPFLFIWLAWSLWRSVGRPAWKPLAVFGLACAVGPGATAVRNYAVSGELVLTTAQGGINFFVGNFRENFWGAGKDPDFAHRTPLWEQSDFAKEAKRRTGRDLSPAELDRFWYKEGIKEIEADPGFSLLRLGRKLLIILNRHEVSDNVHYYFFEDHISFLLRLPLPAFWLAGPFGLAGMALSLWRRKGGVLAIYMASYTATLLAFYIVDRYRMPLVPPLLVFAAYGIFAVIEAARLRDKKALAIYSLAFVPVLALGFPELEPPVFYDSWQKMGHAYLAEEKYGEAIQCYEKALSINPEISQAWLGMGIALEMRNRFDEALEAYRHAAAYDPNFAPAHFLLALSLEKNHFPEEAKKEYEKALELDPELKGARMALDNLERQSKPEEP